MMRRILFFGAGNCSFEKAYCKNELRWGNIEVVITVFEKLDSAVITDIKNQIQKTIPEYRKNSIMISVHDQVDATNTDERLSGQFDEIFFNFPTPRVQCVDMKKVFQNIVKKDLLRKHTMDGQRVKYHPGKFNVAYWFDPYQSEYEYDYRFAKAQRDAGFKLTERNFFDWKKWKDLGYTHTFWSGEESHGFEENKIPMVNTYEENPKYLNEDEEWSESEELRNDALHARFFKFKGNYPNAHQNSYLKICGKLIRRCDYQFIVYQKNPAEYSLKRIKKLIKNGDFREAEKRLKVLLEMDSAKHGIDFSSMDFDHAVSNPIDEAYQATNKISKTTRENLYKYQAGPYDWEVKLKVLTGIEIPVLSSKPQYN